MNQCKDCKHYVKARYHIGFYGGDCRDEKMICYNEEKHGNISYIGIRIKKLTRKPTDSCGGFQQRKESKTRVIGF